MDLKQNPLFPFENPLKTRLGRDFFASVPRTSGVYVMRGEQGDVLYVGKAKNLRARLNSYRQAKPETVSRKVIRMIHLVRKIEWEECSSEKEALLRENALLRSLQPPFNVVNTRPDTYFFIGVARDHFSIQFTLTTEATYSNPDQTQAPAPEYYGAFKGRGLIRRAFPALLRLLWLNSSDEIERFSYPAPLTRYRPPTSYTIRLASHITPRDIRHHERLLRSYFSGRSKRLLVRLTESLLERTDLPPFIYSWIQEDLETLREFFEFGPKRNRRIQRDLKIEQTLIAQDQLDDLLVQHRFRAQPLADPENDV